MNYPHRLALVLASLLSVSAAGVPVALASDAPAPVTVGIVAFNDFHGNIEPPHQSVWFTDDKGQPVPVPAGGAAWLAATIDAVRSEHANHLTVSAGDLIGASQFASSLFLDEPAIGVMNRIGLDFNAVGNHEFDRGKAELVRIQTGGCEQHTLRKPCQLEPYRGAHFPFLAANVVQPDGHTLFPGTALRSFGKGKAKVTVGLIGLTLKETANLASPENLGGVHFADEADTINALVPGLKARGADAIVVLIHQGGRTKGAPNPDACDALSGDILPILNRLDTRVDLIVSGHTHWSYVCDYAKINPAKPFLLTSAGVFGEEVTDITLDIDPKTHRVVRKQAHNVVVQSPAYRNIGTMMANNWAYPHYAPRADIAAYVGKYVDAAKVVAQRPIGKLAGVVSRPGGDASNTGGSLGNLIADAQLAASAGAGAQIAFMNVFGIRAPHQLVPAADGTITFSQIYAVQPFANALVTQTLTGADLKAVLEQGFDDFQPVQALSASHGFTYSYDMARPVGNRVVAMALNGVPIDPAKDYRITTNSFLANGGDSFTLLAKQRDAVIGVPDLDALESWLKVDPARAVPDEARAVDLNPGAMPAKLPPMKSN